MAKRKKTIREYEEESKWVSGYLIHPNKWPGARKSYQLRHGKLPVHIYVCHTCDVRKCILDLHHFPGTQKDNMQDARAKGKMWGDPNYTRTIRQAVTNDWTEERRKAQTKRLVLQWKDPKYRAKFDIIKPGHKKSSAHIQKMSNNAKQQWAALGKFEKEQLLRKLAKSRRTPESRKKASVAAKKRWARTKVGPQS